MAIFIILIECGRTLAEDTIAILVMYACSLVRNWRVQVRIRFVLPGVFLWVFTWRRVDFSIHYRIRLRLIIMIYQLLMVICK